MQKKIAASICLFAFVHMNQDNPYLMSFLLKDFFFAGTAAAYEEHFGVLFPPIGRSSIQETSSVSTFSKLIAEKNGLITRIHDEAIMIQQEDGTEMEVIGLETSSFRLFEKIKQGEPIGKPAGDVVEFIERKNGQIIASRKMGAYETN